MKPKYTPRPTVVGVAPPAPASAPGAPSVPKLRANAGRYSVIRGRVRP